MVETEMSEKRAEKIRPIALSDFKRTSSQNAAALRLVRDPRLLVWLNEIYHARFWAEKKPLSGSAVIVVALNCPGGMISIGVPADLLPALLMAIEADVTGVAAIAPLVASRILAPIFNDLGRAMEEKGDPRWQAIGVSAVRLLNLDAIRPPLIPIATWSIALAQRLHTTVGLLSIDVACTASLQNIVDTLPTRHYAFMNSWCVATMLRLATRSWTAALLESLEVGDVLLCQEDAGVDKLKAELFCGALAGTHKKGFVKVTQRKITLMSQMLEQDGRNNFEGESLAPSLSTSVAELEVPVHFELDSTALTLAQLASLQPGYVIELAIPVQHAEIRLVACGQIIGRGKLVVIGDCLGIQLETLVGENR